VRVRLPPKPNQKRAENWSAELFTVKQVNKPDPAKPWNPYSYLLESLKGRYFNDDLLRVTAVENPVQLPETFEVSRLERPATRDGGRKRGFVVRWTGYSELTFESRESLMLDIPKMVRLFEKRHKVEWKRDGNRWTFKWTKG